MRILISPAKKMVTDTDSFPIAALPVFLPQSERLREVMRGMSPKALQTLWRCNDAIAAQNTERLHAKDPRLTPAILAYEGIQYRYMAPGVLERDQLAYIQEHLRILSGLYGLLRPFDGVTPYRLEMQARLAVDGHRDLYSYWGASLAQALAAETDLLIDLASKEYSRAVLPHLPPTVRVLTCVFGQLQDGKVIEKGTLCKMARGQMVRYMAENNVTRPEELCRFTDLSYQFSTELSTQMRYVFLSERRGTP